MIKNFKIPFIKKSVKLTKDMAVKLTKDMEDF